MPIVHFVATRPNYYKPIYPCFVVEDDPIARQVLVSPGKMIGPFDEREPVVLDDPIERRYVFRETRVRVHQARFRARVVPAYGELCAVCRLKEVRLLDAAHIVGDLDERGEAVVSNGVSLCSIHHRAFDHDLVGITPDYRVRVARRLLDDEDGPMLELLNGVSRAADRRASTTRLAAGPRTTCESIRTLRCGRLTCYRSTWLPPTIASRPSANRTHALCVPS